MKQNYRHMKKLVNETKCAILILRHAIFILRSARHTPTVAKQTDYDREERCTCACRADWGSDNCRTRFSSNERRGFHATRRCFDRGQGFGRFRAHRLKSLDRQVFQTHCRTNTNKITCNACTNTKWPKHRENRSRNNHVQLFCFSA